MPRALMRSKDKSGRVVPGLWENDLVRMEKVESLWCFQVPCREIGRTGYFEFRPLDMGGKWRTAGYRKTREGCAICAEKMLAGEVVLKPASGTGDDHTPAGVFLWQEVAREVADHPSVKEQ